MKKYQQLLLLVVSLSLILIYRQQYNRLRYVLEVFNFFGQPCNMSALQDSQSVLSHHDWGPTPLWQESEDIYVFSAFWRGADAQSIVVQKAPELVPRNCYLWYESKPKPVMGKFSLSKLPTLPSTPDAVFFYHCALTSPGASAPYAVSFTRKNKKPQGLKKILLGGRYLLGARKPHFNATICVSPGNYRKRELLEFISYHALIGVENFIFYSDNIPYRLMKILTNLHTKLGVQLAFFPWNFPTTISSKSSARAIVENDCLSRALNDSRSLTTLEVDEYLVPTTHETFADLMVEFDAERVSLPVLEFCVENAHRDKPVALQNVQVTSGDRNDARIVYRNVDEEKKHVTNVKALDKGFAALHKYRRCEIKPAKTYEDRAIFRYHVDFARSTLVQFLVHDMI